MAASRPLCIGRDVHNETMAVASIAQAHGAEVPSLGTIGTDQCDRDPRIRNRPAKATPWLVLYDAGPGGDWRSRDLTPKGDDGWVVAPSLIPQKAGDRVHTDRRDAGPRARLARSGDLPAVDVPQVEDAALGDLRRARADPRSALQDAKFRLNAFWLRHDSRSTGRAHGSPAPRRGLAEVVCPTPAQHLVWHASGRAVHEPTARLQRRAQARQDHVQAWRLTPGVEALQARRGVPCTVAVPRGAAMGELSRFDTPSALMKFLGLLPSASSAGERRQQGAMTTAGNPHARRALVEGA